jgi:sec-independent protein translocase protein TatB
VFNLSGSELVFILLLALVVLGPERLPDAMRRFGRTVSELRKMGAGFQEEFRSGLDEPMQEMRKTADLIRGNSDFGSFAKGALTKPKEKSPSAMSVGLTPDELKAKPDPAEVPAPEPAAAEPSDDHDVASDDFGVVPSARDEVQPEPDDVDDFGAVPHARDQ